MYYVLLQINLLEFRKLVIILKSILIPNKQTNYH